MGFSTIIELDHDRWKDIADEPEKFAAEILEQLALGPDTQKEIRGGRIITCFHRGDSFIGGSWDSFVKHIFTLRGISTKFREAGAPPNLVDPSKPKSDVPDNEE